MLKCLDKGKLNQRGACLKCGLRFNKCNMPQELIDSNIFLRVYLEERDNERWINLLNKNYIVTLAVGEI